ncbi:hypothetical protein [Sphingomonas sp. PAMC 26605]|uniref:hypothetical protein n=1 Tax=Sphingomonas sp. PAMC 26605 TaxID=1112214 RepID=UPI00026CD70A|nr:hypothetical protein [Sphingomonas sp. PAMC 26605]
MDSRAGKEVHDLINFVGLRAQATAVGLIQLTTELVQAGVLQDDAVTRIKAAIADELELSRPSTVSKAEFDRTTRRRLDRLFSGDEKLTPSPSSGEGTGTALRQTQRSS